MKITLRQKKQALMDSLKEEPDLKIIESLFSLTVGLVIMAIVLQSFEEALV